MRSGLSFLRGSGGRFGAARKTGSAGDPRPVGRLDGGVRGQIFKIGGAAAGTPQRFSAEWWNAARASTLGTSASARAGSKSGVTAGSIVTATFILLFPQLAGVVLRQILPDSLAGHRAFEKAFEMIARYHQER